MQRYISAAILIFVSILTVACEDPAADKPKATTGSATETASSKPEGSETLNISPDNSKVEFIGAKVTQSHEGSFKNFAGTVDLVADKPENSRVRVEIDMASVETDAERLTGHLKSADFFDVAKYPKSVFTTTEIKSGGEGGATHTITGNFDLHGVTKSITFPATVRVTDSEVSVDSEFAINRKDFGILYPGAPDNLIRDDVVIKLSIKAPRARS